MTPIRRTKHRPPSSPRTPPLSPDRFDAIRKDWPGYVAGFVAACLPEPDAAPLHRLGQGTLLPAGPEAAARMLAAHAGLSPALESIAVPTLVVHGAHDAIAPLAQGQELAARIPHAELMVLDDAGHVPIITRPAAVAAAIENWWRRHGCDS